MPSISSGTNTIRVPSQQIHLRSSLDSLCDPSSSCHSSLIALALAATAPLLLRKKSPGAATPQALVTKPIHRVNGDTDTFPFDLDTIEAQSVSMARLIGKRGTGGVCVLILSPNPARFRRA